MCVCVGGTKRLGRGQLLGPWSPGKNFGFSSKCGTESRRRVWSRVAICSHSGCCCREGSCKSSWLLGVGPQSWVHSGPVIDASVDPCDLRPEWATGWLPAEPEKSGWCADWWGVGWGVGGPEGAQQGRVPMSGENRVPGAMDQMVSGGGCWLPCQIVPSGQVAGPWPDLWIASHAKCC